jgi:hypothetical protein
MIGQVAGAIMAVIVMRAANHINNIYHCDTAALSYSCLHAYHVSLLASCPDTMMHAHQSCCPHHIPHRSSRLQNLPALYMHSSQTYDTTSSAAEQ